MKKWFLLTIGVLFFLNVPSAAFAQFPIILFERAGNVVSPLQLENLSEIGNNLIALSDALSNNAEAPPLTVTISAVDFDVISPPRFQVFESVLTQSVHTIDNQGRTVRQVPSNYSDRIETQNHPTAFLQALIWLYNTPDLSPHSSQRIGIYLSNLRSEILQRDSILSLTIIIFTSRELADQYHGLFPARLEPLRNEPAITYSAHAHFQLRRRRPRSINVTYAPPTFSSPIDILDHRGQGSLTSMSE